MLDEIEISINNELEKVRKNFGMRKEDFLSAVKSIIKKRLGENGEDNTRGI